VIVEKLWVNVIWSTDDMGAYLSKPICEKESEDREGDVLNYGASAMQGWRLSQEVRSESRKTGLCSVGIDACLQKI